jgi:hypothetical protein
MKVTLFDSDVSDKDSESDSNNVVSAVTFILHLFPTRRNKCQWTSIRPLSERSTKLPYKSVSQINPAVASSLPPTVKCVVIVKLILETDPWENIRNLTNNHANDKIAFDEPGTKEIFRIPTI